MRILFTFSFLTIALVLHGQVNVIKSGAFDNQVYVELVLGQSNAVGAAEASRQGLTKYPLNPENVYIYTKPTFDMTNNGSFSPLLAGTNTMFMPSADGTTYGAHSVNSGLLASYTKKPVYVIQAARGGTSLCPSSSGGTTPSWAPGESGGCLEYALQGMFTPAIAAIRAANPGANINVYISWHGGEADAANSGCLAAYPTNFPAFQSYVRSYDPLLATAPWIINKIYYNISAGETTLNNYFDTVPGAYVVDVSSQPRKVDLTTGQKGGFSSTTGTGDDIHGSYLTQNYKAEQNLIKQKSIYSVPGDNTEYLVNNFFDATTLSTDHIRLPLNRSTLTVDATVSSTTNKVTNPVNVSSTGSFTTVNTLRFKVDQQHGWVTSTSYDGSNGAIVSTTAIGTTLFSHSFSFGGWFFPVNGLTAQYLIHDIQDANNPNNSRFGVFINASGQVGAFCSVGGNSGSATTSSVVFPASNVKAHHIAVTVASGGNITIYVDGVSSASGSMSSVTLGSYVNGSNPLQIFRRLITATPTYDLYFIGRAREIMIQPVVWSASDIANIMRN